MTLLCFGPDALRASRFAVSPLAETLSEITRLRLALDRRSANPRVEAFARWLDSDPFVDGLLRLVTATKYLPDFVAIPPAAGLNGSLTDELMAMRAIDDAEARATLAEAQRFAWAGDGIAWAEVTGIARCAADVFADGWARFVEPDWARRRAIMERDIHHRAGVIAVSGWRRVLDGTRRPVGRSRRDPVLHTGLRRPPHRQRRPRLRSPHRFVGAVDLRVARADRVRVPGQGSNGRSLAGRRWRGPASRAGSSPLRHRGAQRYDARFGRRH